MNLFSLDIGRLDPDEVKEAFSDTAFDRLPGVPPFLSKEECAAILGVSRKTINHLTEGELPLVDIPSDSPLCFDLFGQPIEPQREVCILRADLINFIEKALLCNKPVLDTEEDR